MNKINNVKIVIISPGHHGVDENIPKQKKMEKRWSEAVCWAECLGYTPDQLIDFRADLQAESLDIISLISELEEQFDQDITDDDAMSLKTVGDAVHFIESSLAKEA